MGDPYRTNTTPVPLVPTKQPEFEIPQAALFREAQRRARVVLDAADSPIALAVYGQDLKEVLLLAAGLLGIAAEQAETVSRQNDLIEKYEALVDQQDTFIERQTKRLEQLDELVEEDD